MFPISSAVGNIGCDSSGFPRCSLESSLEFVAAADSPHTRLSLHFSPRSQCLGSCLVSVPNSFHYCICFDRRSCCLPLLYPRTVMSVSRCPPGAGLYVALGRVPCCFGSRETNSRQNWVYVFCSTHCHALTFLGF
ncbi:hypothetical protein BKA93DRAFT_792757 [Sparassis latifolia]